LLLRLLRSFAGRQGVVNPAEIEARMIAKKPVCLPGNPPPGGFAFINIFCLLFNSFGELKEIRKTMIYG
jgi:hypothetical protein